jgi:twinkle protein
MLAEKAKREMLLGAESEPGLMLPWQKTNGKVLLRPGKLSIWAGWSRHGKTQMLKQVMLHGVKESERILFASMEEEVTEVWKDMAQIACLTREPRLQDLDKFVEFITGKMWLYDQQGMVEPRRMLAVIRYAAKELKVTHVVIDSLMMLAVNRDDYDAQSRFVGELKATAKDTGAHVHLVAHMRKREGKGGEDSPGSLHDVSGGHEIGSMADSVFIVWRDLERADPAKSDVILKVDKQRGRVNWRGKIMLNSHEVSRQFVDGVRAQSFWGDHGPIPF